jgi:hypothetical protein
MKWEMVGKQELWERGTTGKGYAYSVLLWRTPVPGGWLMMAVNAKSNSPDPVVTFYPDPQYAWTIGGGDPQSEYLLRPAQGTAIPATAADELLRPSDSEDDLPEITR